VTRLASYLERHFGKRPSGAWLAERVWEPQMPSALAAAEVSYSLVDDYHFLSAGFEPHELFGAYVAEDRGRSVRLLPGLKALRYLLPFGRVEDVIQFLKEAAATHSEGVAAMGDDMEKLGVWPGTFDHCYRDRWLENFFEALEANLDWLSLTPPGEYIQSHKPLGRADLPTASYAEMTEWALPTLVRRRYHTVQQEFSGRSEVAGFLRGGSWRDFFASTLRQTCCTRKCCERRRGWRRCQCEKSPAGRRKNSPKREICCCGDNAMMRSGTVCLVDSMRRTCARPSGRI